MGPSERRPHVLFAVCVVFCAPNECYGSASTHHTHAHPFYWVYFFTFLLAVLFVCLFMSYCHFFLFLSSFLLLRDHSNSQQSSTLIPYYVCYSVRFALDRILSRSKITVVIVIIIYPYWTPMITTCEYDAISNILIILNSMHSIKQFN